MTSIFNKAAIAVFAVAVCLGIGASQAAVVVNGGSSATLDGWEVQPAAGISLTLNSVGGVLQIEKVANFTAPNVGLMITFLQTSTSASPTVEFTNEAVTNSTGSAWNEFQFLLLSPNSSVATFSGNTFVPAAGYSSPTLNAAKDTLNYPGSQASGTIADWGGTNASDNLMISAGPLSSLADGGQVFAFKEQPTNGGSSIPLPAAAWQALVGLLGLATISGLAKLKKQIPA